MNAIPTRRRRAARWALAALAGTAALAAGAVATGLHLAEQRAERRVALPARPVAIPADAASLARGRYLYTTRGCADCHGADGGGRTFVDDGGLRLTGPDITTGGAGVTRHYASADWERTLRHGVKPDGRVLRVMPSQDYQALTDADLGALVAHVRTLPPAAGRPAEIVMPLAVKLMYGFGRIPDAVDLIDHQRPPAEPVPEAPTVAHGRYVAAMCVGCHGPALQGGRIPGAPPSWPAAPDLRPQPDGVLARRYADPAAFTAMLRSGRRADGSAVAVMPFESLKHLSDTDAQALHRFLASLPAPADG